MGQAYLKSGYKSAMKTWLDHITSPSSHLYVSPFFIATLYARLGEGDRALDWLAKAYQGRDTDLVFLKVEPALDNLRSDPRYAELERQIGFPAVISQAREGMLSRPSATRR